MLALVGNPRKSVFSSKAKMKAKTGDPPMETPRVLEGIPVLAMVHFVHFEVYHVGMTERLDLLLPPEGVPANELKRYLSAELVVAENRIAEVRMLVHLLQQPYINRTVMMQCMSNSDQLSRCGFMCNHL
jgi:hypothetical protein